MPETRGRPRKYNATRAATGSELNRAAYKRLTPEDKKQRLQRRNEIRLDRVAMLDFETDPFDSDKPETQVLPFTACLYGGDFGTVIIWEQDYEIFVSRLLSEIERVTVPHTIYAHNGGKFDFMFLVHKLRGRVSFKGRSLMAAEIGIHSLRDSSHILPMKLSEWKKDDFDYSKMTRDKRDMHKAEIIEYMTNDCISLHSIVIAFLREFGFKLTIGQAAMSELKKEYKVAKLGAVTDETLRPYFFGGRVECLAGAGHYKSRRERWKLYDVNSMYPHAMAAFRHPIGSHYSWRRRGGITEKTAFLEVRCRNYSPGGIGALIARVSPDDTSVLETTSHVEYGIFHTTIWEFQAALDLGLISDVEILQYIDNDTFTDFSRFIVPMYERRQQTKSLMRDMKKAGVDPEAPEFLAIKKEDLFLKFLMNNSYGKFAMNPRRFKDAYITEHGGARPEGYDDQRGPIYQNAEMGYDIWEKPAPIRGFNNVGTAASITGAARSILLRAICNATDPIYCDTDSLICKSLDNVEIDKVKLGAWDLEAEFDEVIIAGKKLYACLDATKPAGHRDRYKVRSKGIPEGRLGWNEMLRLLDGDTIETRAFAPTLKRTMDAEHWQIYMPRRVRRTAPFMARGSIIMDSYENG